MCTSRNINTHKYFILLVTQQPITVQHATTAFVVTQQPITVQHAIIAVVDSRGFQRPITVQHATNILLYTIISTPFVSGKAQGTFHS
jgi:hypothetical protein